MDALCSCSEKSVDVAELRKDQGLHECEVLGDGPEVEESRLAWENCKKIQNSHANFIPVRMFSEDHLPGSFDKRRLLEFILLMAKLTVRLRVNHISANRPDGYPFASQRGKNITFTGSGWVYKILPGEGPCPCQDRCEQPHHSWWRCYVLTACHVVYDRNEANETKVDLFYDTDKSFEDNEVKTLYGYAVEDNNQKDDVCLLLCATHDEDLVNTLIGLIQKYYRERWVVPQPIMSTLCVVISHPHGQPKKVTVGDISSTAPVDLEASDLTEYMYTYTTETCRGSSGAPVVCAVSHKQLESEGVWPGAGPHSFGHVNGTSLNQCGPGIFYVEADILDETLRLGGRRYLKIGRKSVDVFHIEGFGAKDGYFGAAAAATAAAVTTTPTAPSASALSRPLEDVRQRFLHQGKHWIMDVQLLPGGRLLLADWNDECVRLFDTRGQHLHTLECRSEPYRLAVLDSSSIRHTVAVTLPHCSGIDILEVNGDNMEVKRTLQTSRQYFAVAAVNNLTLAVGYWLVSGIDLIDLGGQVLRQICSSVDPLYMDITEDGGLMCSTVDDKIARVQVDTGTVVFNKSVPQIKCPCGVAITSDGSILVTDIASNTLHLVSSQGIWVKKLWSVPSDRDQRDELWNVSTDGSVCVCVTRHGSVYILDCL